MMSDVIILYVVLISGVLTSLVISLSDLTDEFAYCSASFTYIEYS